MADRVRIPKMPDDAESARFFNLLGCSGFTIPANSRFKKEAAEGCVNSVDSAVKDGTITTVLAAALALRQIPYTNARGDDNIAGMSDAFAFLIDENPKAKSIVYGTVAGAKLLPFTHDEILSITTPTVLPRPSPDMVASRPLPFDTGTAYMATAADVSIHPQRYTAEGKNIADTVAQPAFAKAVQADVANNMAWKCMARENLPEVNLERCSLVAARRTLQNMATGTAKPYDPAVYGIAGKSAQR